MTRALVIRREVLDHVETRESGLVERHVIGRADALDDVARRTEILERREPAIEDRLCRGIPFHVEAQCLATTGIVVQIDGQLISRGWGREVLREVGARAEESLLLATPQRHPDRA